MPKNAVDTPPDFFPTKQDEFIFAKIEYLNLRP